MAFEYSKLRGRIVEKYGTSGAFAKAMGLAPSQVSFLLNNRQDWRPALILKACDILDIAPTDISAYFFSVEDKKS